MTNIDLSLHAGLGLQASPYIHNDFICVWLSQRYSNVAKCIWTCIFNYIFIFTFLYILILLLHLSKFTVYWNNHKARYKEKYMCAYSILHENVSDCTHVCISVYINSKTHASIFWLWLAECWTDSRLIKESIPIPKITAFVSEKIFSIYINC